MTLCPMVRQFHCEEVGELLAIRAFKEGKREIGVSGVSDSEIRTVFSTIRQDQPLVYHRFEHRDYNTYIGA